MQRTAPIPALIVVPSHIDPMRQTSVSTPNTRRGHSSLAGHVKSGSAAIHLEAMRTIALTRRPKKCRKPFQEALLARGSISRNHGRSE